jgi:hypothetical protein
MEPEQDGGARMQSRRDFAKRIGAALGGVSETLPDFGLAWTRAFLNRELQNSAPVLVH